MAEVFILGVLASLTKIATMAYIVLGLSFWAYVAFSLCFLIAVTRLDRYQFWRTILPYPAPKAISGRSAARQGLAHCHICTLTSPEKLNHCPRCGATLHYRIPQSLQRTVALLITSSRPLSSGKPFTHYPYRSVWQQHGQHHHWWSGH